MNPANYASPTIRRKTARPTGTAGNARGLLATVVRTLLADSKRGTIRSSNGRIEVNYVVPLLEIRVSVGFVC